MPRLLEKCGPLRYTICTCIVSCSAGRFRHTAEGLLCGLFILWAYWISRIRFSTLSWAAALTATQTPGDYAPFALGCVAACGPGAGGIAALLGAGVGAVLFLDFSGALPFLAAAILIFTTAAALQGLKLLEGPLFHPLAGAGLFLAVPRIYVPQSLSPLRNLAPCLAATALVGLPAW